MVALKQHMPPCQSSQHVPDKAGTAMDGLREIAAHKASEEYR